MQCNTDVNWYEKWKQLETHECIISNVTTDVLVLSHPAISSYSADSLHIVMRQFDAKILHLQQATWETKTVIWKRE